MNLGSKSYVSLCEHPFITHGPQQVFCAPKQVCRGAVVSVKLTEWYMRSPQVPNMDSWVILQVTCRNLSALPTAGPLELR